MKHVMSLRRKAINHAHRQRGASLLEGIAYLGIAAIVVIGAVALMRGAFSSAQSNSLVQDVVSIRTNVRKLFMGQGGYANANNANLIAARAFPDTLTAGASNVLNNTWGGITWVATPANNASQFTINYNQVPREVCINALSGTSGWVSVAVNNANTTQTFPIPPATATTLCNAEANAIVWTAS